MGYAEAFLPSFFAIGSRITYEKKCEVGCYFFDRYVGQREYFIGVSAGNLSRAPALRVREDGGDGAGDECDRLFLFLVWRVACGRA